MKDTSEDLSDRLNIRLKTSADGRTTLSKPSQCRTSGTGKK
jgi:hypothetical protein